MNTRLFSFAGGATGEWRVVSMSTIVGTPLAEVTHLDVVTGALAPTPDAAEWVLRGLTSNERYVTRSEKDQLVARQPALGRAHATCAALIPILKTASWWSLAQDERRRIFEESSRHVATGLRYLPAVARRLHHCRDLGESEPFDFLTWFEYGASDAPAFDALVAELRASEEWRYVDREIDIRVVRAEEPVFGHGS
jgi:chlorite dismutase